VSETAPFVYNASDNLWSVNVFAGVRFTRLTQVEDAFEACHRYWDLHIKQRCYVLIDYTDTVVDKGLLEAFADKRRTIVSGRTITTLRFTADIQARTAIRAMSIKIHQPSNLYASREEALAVLERIRAGSVAVDADASGASRSAWEA
jgi:hypothetical protein